MKKLLSLLLIPLFLGASCSFSKPPAGTPEQTIDDKQANNIIENAKSIQDCKKLPLPGWGDCIDKTLASEADYKICLTQAKTKEFDFAVNACNNTYGKLQDAKAANISDCQAIVTTFDRNSCIEKTLKTVADYRMCVQIVGVTQSDLILSNMPDDVCQRVFWKISKDGALCDQAKDESEVTACWQAVLSSIARGVEPEDCLRLAAHQKECFAKLFEFYKVSSDYQRIEKACGLIFNDTKLPIKSIGFEACTQDIIFRIVIDYSNTATSISQCSDLVDKTHNAGYFDECIGQTMKTAQDYNLCLQIAKKQPAADVAVYQEHCKASYSWLQKYPPK